MARQCADCRFFNNGEEGMLGECRRHAPGAHLVQCGATPGGIDMIAIWPLIDPEDWCGEYEEKRQ